MLWVALALALLALCLVAGALVSNRLPLAEPPGPLARLGTYLSTNVAETRADHPHAELRPLALAAPPEAVFPALIDAVEAMGWTLAWTDVAERRFEAAVRTPLLGFVDDVRIEVRAAPGGGSLVEVRSRSRVGRGDLGANTRHVLDVFEAARGLGPTAPAP